MRTENEIKDELNFLSFVLKGGELEENIRIETEIEMLEWVLEIQHLERAK